MSGLPVSGIRILDLRRVPAGPLSAQMLADLGAEVIKIERPGGGDDARIFGPPYLVDPDGKGNNNNSFYLCANRNKQSVAVDIAKPAGQEIVRELAKSADIMMENFKVGDLMHYAQIYLANGETPPRRGTSGNGGVPARVFTCADQEIMLVVGNDSQFEKCCGVLGHPELARDPRFVKNNDRVVHRVELMQILEDLFIQKPAKYWLDEVERVGVPAGPANKFPQGVRCEQGKRAGYGGE